jgi:hypothetical protein
LQKTSQAGVSVFLLFDEIDSAMKISNGEAGLFLRSLVSQGHLVAICTSFLWPDEVDVSMHQAASPWFNVYSIRTLGQFQLSESIEMLQVLSDRSGYTFTEAECLFLIDMLGNHPFYLQTAGLKLFGLYSYATILPLEREAILKKAVGSLFKEDLVWHLQYLVDHLSADDFGALLAIANGKSMKDEPVHRIARLGLITRSDNDWIIPSRIMKEFLKALPTPGLGERIRDSSVWKAISGLTSKAFEVAVEKAAEAAAGKYLS